MHQIDYELQIRRAHTIIALERNRMLREFVESDCTHMLCIDSDLGFDYRAIIPMLKANRDFVAGLYPIKGDPKFFYAKPTYDKQGNIPMDQEGFIPMLRVPAGFMLLGKAMCVDLYEQFVHLTYVQEQDPRNYGVALFNTTVQDKEYIGEDYYFCDRVRDCAYQIWIYPNIDFDHAGTKGNFSHILQQVVEESS